MYLATTLLLSSVLCYVRPESAPSREVHLHLHIKDEEKNEAQDISKEKKERLAIPEKTKEALDIPETGRGSIGHLGPHVLINPALDQPVIKSRRRGGIMKEKNKENDFNAEKMNDSGKPLKMKQKNKLKKDTKTPILQEKGFEANIQNSVSFDENVDIKKQYPMETLIQQPMKEKLSMEQQPIGENYAGKPIQSGGQLTHTKVLPLERGDMGTLSANSETTYRQPSFVGTHGRKHQTNKRQIDDNRDRLRFNPVKNYKPPSFVGSQTDNRQIDDYRNRLMFNPEENYKPPSYIGSQGRKHQTDNRQIFDYRLMVNPVENYKHPSFVGSHGRNYPTGNRQIFDYRLMANPEENFKHPSSVGSHGRNHQTDNRQIFDYRLMVNPEENYKPPSFVGSHGRNHPTGNRQIFDYRLMANPEEKQINRKMEEVTIHQDPHISFLRENYSHLNRGLGGVSNSELSKMLQLVKDREHEGEQKIG